MARRPPVDRAGLQPGPEVGPLVLEIRISGRKPATAAAVLAERSGLAKARIKDAMNKGAVWLTRAGTARRLRRASQELKAGDRLALYYDAALLTLTPPPVACLADAGRYSVWIKPPGLMAQGNRFGDHCSLVRQAELALWPRPAFPVHRLDREAAGLMLVAHDQQAAAAFSRLFAERAIRKRYLVEVLGQPAAPGQGGSIDSPLDDKPAHTDYRVLERREDGRTALLEAFISTGRRHQLRRHLAATGHPVMGDPRYGKGNKNRIGLRLWAVGLAFVCPFSGQEQAFTWEPETAAPDGEAP
ncbi:MAG: RNA pseudouridine synthase [Thermodesulfobacteriota bacterium]